MLIRGSFLKAREMVEEATPKRWAISASRTVLIWFCGIFSIRDKNDYPVPQKRGEDGLPTCATICTKRRRQEAFPGREWFKPCSFYRLHDEPARFVPTSNCLPHQYSCQKSNKNCIKPETFSWTTKRKCFQTSKPIRAKKLSSPFTRSHLKVRSGSSTRW